ncbi:MAG: LEA type 2 family protein [Candidatus Thiodiazotropha sp. (ex Ctena orbiculata)]|uniref:LEA type 2 family protein n=1 Tax=Candidatus Thiodiazotropha taylori TaxID=2792791 RepID=A0A944M9V9_9GAMM|nr:LEA type 2 family protein [Candidatus Thiodiazotropha taylori]MBV2135251.1 LEA type 2 family protein [Candidatus Thiodiazotropha taylori]
MTLKQALLLMVSLPLWLLQGCSSLDQVNRVMEGRKPTAQVAGVRFDGLDFKGVDLVFDLKIDNPNPFSIDLTGFDYDLQLFGQSFIKGRQTKGLSLGAKSDSRVALPLRLDFKQLLHSYRQLHLAEEASYRLDLGLGFKMPVIGTLRLPVDIEGSFPVPRLPAFSVRSLGVKRLSLEEAELELQLEIDNPNRFSLLLQQLDYHFKLNGIAIANGLIEQPLTIEQDGVGMVAIPLSVNLRRAGMGLYSALLNRSGLNYELNGSLDATTSNALLKRLQIPLDKQGSIKLR